MIFGDGETSKFHLASHLSATDVQNMLGYSYQRLDIAKIAVRAFLYPTSAYPSFGL